MKFVSRATNNPSNRLRHESLSLSRGRLSQPVADKVINSTSLLMKQPNQTSGRRRDAEEFRMPSLTVTWKQCEEAWDAIGSWNSLGHVFTAGELLDCEGSRSH